MRESPIVDLIDNNFDSYIPLLSLPSSPLSFLIFSFSTLPLPPSSSPGCSYIRCEEGGDILSQDWYPYPWYCGEHEWICLSSLLG